jgi:hypothetical protein
VTPAPNARKHPLFAAMRSTWIAGLTVLLAAAPARAARVEDRISLPPASQPEGIAIAPGGTFYTGSLATGTIYRGDVRTGAVDVLVSPDDGRVAVGMELDRGLLYVAGGPTGAYVYDASSGETVRTYSFSPGGFVNDVVVTKDAAWFTDSFTPFLYRVPVSPSGVPASASDAEAVRLTGDFSLRTGFNLNGIDAPSNGKVLVVVQSNTGKLFRVDPVTGVTSEVDLGGDTVTAGDGLLLHGRLLYVVQNEALLLTTIRLDPSLTFGTVLSRRTDDDFDVPTTLDRQGRHLYVINARFGTTPTPETAYWIAVLRR